MPGTAEYVFYLDVRQIRLVNPNSPILFTPRPTHLNVANRHFEERLGTPEKLMDFAQRGDLSKHDLAALLMPEKREIYLGVCARFERALTQTCAAKNDPCLESGCAFEGESEACLNAILNAGKVYTLGCVSMWECLFLNPANRIPSWRS